MTFFKTLFTSNRRGWSFRRDGVWKTCILASFFIFAICVLPVANHPVKDKTSNSEQSAEQPPPIDEHIVLESSSKNEEEPIEVIREKRQILDFDLNDQIDLSNLASLYGINAQLFDGGQSFDVPVSMDLGNLGIQLESFPDASDILQNMHFTIGNDFDFGNLPQTISIGNMPGVTSDSGTIRIENGGESPFTIYIGETPGEGSVNGDQIEIGNIDLNIPVVEIDPNQLTFDGSGIRIISVDDLQQSVHVCQGADCPGNTEISINLNSDVGLIQMSLGNIDICQLSSSATNINELDSSNIQIHVPNASGPAYTLPIAISITNGESQTINLSGQDCALIAQQYSAGQTANGYNVNVGGDITCSIVLSSLDIAGCPGGTATPAPTTPKPTTPKPTTPKPTTPKPTTPKPTTPKPTTPEPTTPKPTTPKPTTPKPTTPKPTTPKPTTPKPTTPEPTTPKPTTPKPTTPKPTTPKPTTPEPTTPKPTTPEPTTPKPTTPKPTTPEPTTPKPTTPEPTTPEPTTPEPTTPEPTTAEPTTAEPTTAEPTTAEPTTAEPTTAEPTTPEPTTTLPETTTKQLSRRDRYKDGDAAPCEDFYQYACGGFEADSDLKETNLEEEANKRILAEAKTRSNSEDAEQFTAYYESCVKCDERLSESERMRLAVQAVKEVGKLFVEETWANKEYDLTDLLIKLLQHDSPLLFDVNIDVDHRDPGKYIITLEPPRSKSPLYVFDEENDCRVFQNQKNTDPINLLELHTNYESCKKYKSAVVNTTASMTKELLSSNITDVVELERLAQSFQNDAEKLLLQRFLWIFPSEDEVYRQRTSKNFVDRSVDELEDEIGDIGIDWKRLLSTVTKTQVTGDTTLQVYSLEELIVAFDVFRHVSHMKINNALIALYFGHIYHELIVPRPADIQNYCMSVAKHFMRAQTSRLYLSSYSDEDLRTINERVSTLFEALRETLRLDVATVAERAPWFGSNGHKRLLEKINKLTLVQPDPSAYENNQIDFDARMKPETTLSNNFFENTMKLRKNYRTSLYNRLTMNLNDPKEIWNHFAVPYQTEALPLYGTNQIVIPYGWIGQSSLLEPNISPMDYSVPATLGHIISRQIAHQFDNSSIKFNAKDDLYADDVLAENSRRINAECYEENNEVPRSILLPSNQKIHYKITNKSADEIFADVVALNLTYNTMLRLTPEFGVENGEEVKQFFLDYAQMQCTKIPLTSSGTSTLAFQYLPSRIRMMVVAEQSHPLRKAFRCPQRQEPICDVFPYIKPVQTSVGVLEAEARP